ncbi:hypothetical protein [Azospirillum sp. TSH100]|uniref:hypothetical protein n=1 Tax=Azospirillum sp. TSH100 TaxID=652764 RepID=UPI000D69AAA2|nr:hypothetical protein [Azospirillum sp. TSH100]QCG87450.1 hypothetical protein E6C72_06760 [Azospirillum sp. TSH100]
MSDTGLALLAFGIPAITGALFLAATILMVRLRGWRRLYWACCAIMIAGGSAGAVSALCCLPPMILPDGSVSGEMPPTFGAGLTMAVTGCGSALLGLLVFWFMNRSGMRRRTHRPRSRVWL